MKRPASDIGSQTIVACGRQPGSDIDSKAIVASSVLRKRPAIDSHVVLSGGIASQSVIPNIAQASAVLKRPAMKRPAGQIEMHRREKMPRGHYDVIGVHRNATANDIRNAFRAGALLKHPDKGGTVEDWNRFWEAWETLKDETLHTTYNRELSRSNCQDGLFAGSAREQAEQPLPQHSRLELGQARRLLEQYLLGVCADEALEAALRQWELDRCLALLELTRGPRAKMDAMQNAPRGRTAANVQGISKRANGKYKVYVAWRCFRLESLETPCLAKALDYHLGLDSLKQNIMLRQRKEFILVEELLTTLLVSPHLQIRFVYRRRMQNGRFGIKTFWTPRFVDVQLAELHSQRLCAATTRKAARDIIREAKREDAKNRKTRNERFSRLKDALAAELARKAKTAELGVKRLQDGLAVKTEKVKALQDALQHNEDQIVSRFRSQIMPVLQFGCPTHLLNGFLTRELWPVAESNCCCRIIEFLSFRDLRAFQEASYATKCSRDLGIVWLFKNFQYVPGDARIGLVPPRSHNGRDIWRGGARGITAQRIFLESFLPRQIPLLRNHEQTCLDFSCVKGWLLEVHAVRECLSALQGLKQIILPNEGWTCPMQKRHVLKAFTPDVKVVLNGGSNLMLRRQARAKKCPRGHDLQRLVNNDGDANTCDRCGNEVHPPEFFFGCVACDFDYCQECYGAWML